MKRRIPQRVLSAFLALVLLISSCPTVYAAETEIVEETIAVVAETESPETEAVEPESVPMTEASEEPETEAASESTEAPEQTETVTEPIPETEAAVETEAAEETEPAEETAPEETIPEETISEETVPEETVPEETEAAVLPYGFAGLPEGYVLSEEAAARKQAMIDAQVVESLSGLTAGVDYAAEWVTAYAESGEEATLMAEAFSGELISWNYGVAKIRLLTATVPEAVEASLDPKLPLPAVSPDYVSRVEPMETPATLEAAKALPEMQTWETWVRENMSNPDPALLNPGERNYQWMHDTVDTYAAWGVTTGDSWVKVAIIDSGVNTSHTDLKGHISTINIGLGTSDAVSHGTHVAGIIGGAMNNGSGGAGIAPGVSLISIRACNDYGEFYDSDMAAAIRAAVDAGANIINMSIQGPWYNWMLQDAISEAVANGVTVIAAMGNSGSNTISYPAAYDGVIGVAATNSAGNRAHFSNYGEWADVAAPGENIISSVSGGGYASYDGTSMAAPVVTGVAALYMSAMGGHVNPAEMEKALESSATKVKDSGMGAGIVNIANMLDGVPAAPVYLIYDGEYYYDTKDVIPCDAYVYFFESETTAFNGTTGDVGGGMIMTLDGKAPSVKDGQIINGACVEDTGRLSLEDFADSTVTIKAARISGMGILGKVLSLKLKVGGSDDVDSVTIHGPSYLNSGKSATFTATVEPAATADQTVYWEILDWEGYMYGAKIDSKTGKLTVPKGTGKVWIGAVSMADPSVYAVHEVTVDYMPAVSKIYLNYTNAYLYVGEGGTIKVTRMTDANGYGLNLDYYDVQWTSSNPKIASVDANGYVTGLSKGSVTITCKAMDGSNKTAKCKVEVRQMVTDITLSGQNTIAPGTSATYKATIAPKNATYNKVTWFLQDAPYGVTIDAKSGKVTVASFVRQETVFTVGAMAQDEYGFYATMDVTVRAKCTAVYIGTDGYDGYAAGVQYNNKWLDSTHRTVKTVNLFSLDLDNSEGVDNEIDLDCWFSGPSNYIDCVWTSSAPAVASVDSYGVVTAHKAGSAKITITALDGSNKKASCEIKVTNPASSISISSSVPRMSSDRYYLAFGKSAKNTPVFADTYGKPANQKVSWMYTVLEVDGNDYVLNDWTNFFAANKLITLNNSGTLSVKAAAQNYWYGIDGEFVVTVYAMAEDGSGAWTTLDYTLIPPTTKMIADSNYVAYVSDGSGYGYFWSDQWYGLDASFSATSSNPKVASVFLDGNNQTISYEGRDSYSGLNLYKVHLTLPGYRGSSKITVKATDGSNKSCSFTIKVY